MEVAAHIDVSDFGDSQWLKRIEAYEIFSWSFKVSGLERIEYINWWDRDARLGLSGQEIYESRSTTSKPAINTIIDYIKKESLPGVFYIINTGGIDRIGIEELQGQWPDGIMGILVTELAVAKPPFKVVTK